MTATITNHTNPGQTPVQGDLVTTESEGCPSLKNTFLPWTTRHQKQNLLDFGVTRS